MPIFSREVLSGARLVWGGRGDRRNGPVENFLQIGRYAEELGQLVLRVAMSERYSISSRLWLLRLRLGRYALAHRVVASRGSQTLW